MPGRRRSPAQTQVRCYTRALKNAGHLKQHAPEVFAQDPDAEGFGTGVPLEILRALHRIRHDSPVLNRHKQVADVIRKHPAPFPHLEPRDPLFSGTVHFAQITFHTSAGDQTISTATMQQIVRYAQHAIGPVSKYAAQYGPNTVSVSSTLLTTTVDVPSGSFSDHQLKGWINQLAGQNGLGTDSCIFVVVPKGVSAPDVSANAGYHGKANIPYVAAGVDATRLTLADRGDRYAMVVSHELAELVVDPNVAGANPEVCDPCDLNCHNLTRCYFDSSDRFLGSNTRVRPGGFPFTYYTCAVVKPAAARECPAPAGDCQYAP